MTGVDIGRAPALSFANYAQDKTPGRRLLNLRWLACTLLTGIAGAALMGGALFIAFDRQAEFATSPTAGLDEMADSDGIVGIGRSDRLFIRSEEVSSRQVIQETTVRNVGGKEFVHVLPYVRVSASLSAGRGSASEHIPEFDPNEIFASVGAIAMKAETETADTPKQDDALKVSFSPLQPTAGGGESSDSLDIAEIEEMLRESFSPGHEALGYAPTALLPVSASALGSLGSVDMHTMIASSEMARAAAGGANTTTIFKRTPPRREETVEQVAVEVRRGDTLMSILVDHGATSSEAMEIISKLEDEEAAVTMRVGQTVRLTMAPALRDPGRVHPIAVSLPGPDGETTIAGTDPSAFLRQLATLGSLGLRRTNTVSQPIQAVARSSQTSSRANVYHALYETGFSHEVPRELIDHLVRIFAFDVDFQRSVSVGDAIELFYAESGEEQTIDDPEILFAAITLRGETHRFYRFRHPEDGIVDYYDEAGRSAKKFLIRKPISGGTFRSGFGMRRHPILGYSRMHSGVDWSARTGTPIMAAGGGNVIEAQWRSGYGNHVRIRHANGYETTYSHMSGFADGVRPGARVHQGQVIGYVGSTGMSTGPHLHYEVLVNGRNVDPMRIRLPRGRTLEGRVLVAFERELARIDALMNRAPTSTRMAAY